ncbi:biotin/lipoyl-binding protein [Vibrio sp. CAIM 722]|uniref:Biotin/lipoyl-binding protein n=1 Tax=Vibrio eleionomae TaxID=2653505 RepID=A0A7X4LJA3_9VIBR|nr:biotin/lipoyl-binding protein [Vibrio eleionomae]MZI92876.1 biotin/lipoyl-binding protein [Vibrio eleionomae]
MSPNVESISSGVESALLTVLQLQQKVRAARSIKELQFIILNQTHELVTYDQAMLWDGVKREIVGASAVMSVDKQAPFAQFMVRQSQQIVQGELATTIHCVDQTKWSQDEHREARDYFSAQLIWVPLLDSNQELMAGLWLSRPHGLSIREKRLLSFVADSYGYVWQSMNRNHVKRLPAWVKNRRVAAVFAIVLLGVMALPVRQTVLAPAEVVSSHTLTVRMPIDGLIDQILVKPNSVVKPGQPLFDLDSQQLNDQLAQAQQQLSIASAELRLARQQSFYDASRKASISVLEGKRNLARSQVVYLQKKVAQTTVLAKQGGIALFADQGDWVGRALRLGEPVMDIVDPQQTEIEVQLAVEDRMDLAVGDEVRLFLNSRPTDPIHAKLRTVAYRSTLQNDGHYAFILKASLVTPEHSPTMGLKGIAKVYGEKTSVFYYLFRRPLAHLRLWWSGL